MTEVMMDQLDLDGSQDEASELLGAIESKVDHATNPVLSAVVPAASPDSDTRSSTGELGSPSHPAPEVRVPHVSGHDFMSQKMRQYASNVLFLEQRSAPRWGLRKTRRSNAKPASGKMNEGSSTID